ncbi:MAG: succinylglutamate desuccinylase/aspartoacylase family protein [Betaproteobacteria bacterium]
MTNPSKMHFKSIAYNGQKRGPRLIVTGAVHGNEVCGPLAIRRVLDDIDAGRLAIVTGQVTFVPVTNPLAYARGQRAGDRNLNRNMTPTAYPVDFEDRVGNWLCPLLAQHDALLDLHSTRAQNPPFAMLGPHDNTGTLEPFAHADEERALALRLGVHRFVDGWLGTYAIGVERRIRNTRAAGGQSNPLTTDPRYGIGTTEYMRSVGGYSITLECGQHDDPESPEVGYCAILNTLAFLGLSDAPPPPAVDNIESISLVDVIDRAHAGDTFSRAWSSFNRLKKGDLIGTRHDGTQVTAPEDGFIVFPDARAEVGNEWFYLARVND